MTSLRFALAILVLTAVVNADSSALDVANYFGNGPHPEGGLMDNLGRRVSALHPSNWIQKVVDNVPSVDNISFKSLVSMPVNAASNLLMAVFQHSYLNPFSGSLFTPDFDKINMYLITANGNVSVPLNNPSSLKNHPELSTGEVTIFVSGFPSNSEDPTDAVTELVDAYRARYELGEYNEEYTNTWEVPTIGNLIVVDLGNYLNTFKRWFTLDIEKVGEIVGDAIVNISEFVPYYNIHLVGHSVGAHVAGVAARHYSQEKGNQLRRVTGLDPTKIFTKSQHVHSELSRGVADFVDVIHTTSYGVGGEANGDVDFYPNGPGSVAPGSEHIIDASLKALRYYAESVRPGSERNFMAVECNSLEDYQNHHCYGIRVPMGYSTPYDAKGGFVLTVNSRAPYGRNARNRPNRRRSSVYSGY